MKDFHITPTQLRLLLSTSLVVVAIGAGVIFALIGGTLRTVATDVSHVAIDADASQNNLQSLTTIQKQLEDKKEVVERASSIVADSQSYQYQDQIITDLGDYATRAGITITNIDFTQAAAGAPATATPPTGMVVPSGVKSTSVSITLKSPVPYENLLRFIHSVEQNLTKMQISKVNISKDTAGNGVSSEALTIEVYIR